ncbi:MAG: hypothetical protein JNM69_04270 [Archangium sp.]|nr:hypothetical protein [Archangium sp.]
MIRRLIFGMMAVALGTSCAPKEVKYGLSIVTTGCASANPFQGVQYLRIRVTGDGITTPPESLTPASTKTAVLPEIPAGTNRVIEVRAYDNDPAAGGRVVSIGKTLPFTVPDIIDGEIPEADLQKSVILRQVGVWTQPVSVNERDRCQSMRVARAAHTATLLPSGKVLLAGGFNFPPANPNRVALGQTEIFDPSTGLFTPAQELSFAALDGSVNKQVKAFHTATLLNNRQVLFWGGERYQVISGVNVVAPLTEVLVYDIDTNKFTATQRSTPPAIPRSQHRAVIDKNGKVLIVGGLRFSTSGTGPRLVPVNEVESFDPLDRNGAAPRIVAGVTQPRVDTTAAAVKSGEFVAVAGGHDGTTLKEEVVFFAWDDMSAAFRQVAQMAPPRIATPGRRSAAGVTFRDGSDMLLLGGYSDVTALKPVTMPMPTSEIVQAGVQTVARGPDIGLRGELCAVTLQDGKSVLAVGGRTADSNGMMSRSETTTVIVRNDPQGMPTTQSAPNLTIGRYLHTCTLLLDGSVLVTGGLNETTANPTGDVLADAWIYTPAPND